MPATNTSFISTSARLLLDALLPPRCPVTGQIVAENGTVAPELWSRLNFIQKPFCKTCGNPFAHGDANDDLTCGACMRETPAFTRARASLRYDEASAGMILSFKHGDKTLLANVFATWLAHSGAELLEGADYLIPVPLHRWRLLKRRYNQAGLLAAALSRKTSIPVLNFTLKRKRATESQGHKSRAQRFENLQGALVVENAAKIAGKKLIVIDDVMTSGATVSECAKALLRAGAAQIDVLTLARIVTND